MVMSEDSPLLSADSFGPEIFQLLLADQLRPGY